MLFLIGIGFLGVCIATGCGGGGGRMSSRRPTGRGLGGIRIDHRLFGIWIRLGLNRWRRWLDCWWTLSGRHTFFRHTCLFHGTFLILMAQAIQLLNAGNHASPPFHSFSVFQTCLRRAAILQKRTDHKERSFPRNGIRHFGSKRLE